MGNEFFKHVDYYFETYTNRWAETTNSQLRCYFNSLARILPDPTDTNATYEILAEKYAKSTVIEVWRILTSYYGFLLEQGYYKGDNVFRTWGRRNARALRDNGERTRKVEITFEEAWQRIQEAEIPEHARKTLRFILNTGLRRHEIHRLSGDSTRVMGKGQKLRSLYPVSECALPEKVPSNSELVRHCKKIGVYGPHALRKLYATRLVGLGLEPQDLCHVMGWSNIKTAYTYLQPTRDDKLRGMISD